MSWYPCSSVAPSTDSIPLDMHSGASHSYPRLTSGLLVLSAPVCIVWGARRGIRRCLLCTMPVCVLLNFHLPSSALSNRLSQVSIQTSSWKIKHKPLLLLTSSSNPLISAGVSAFCIFLSSYLYFSKEWFLLPPSCY